MSTHTPRVRIDRRFEREAEVVDLVEHFEACELPIEQWTHRAHLAVATWYVRQYSFDDALNRIRERINQYNNLVGDGNGYHETLTQLFMRKVAQFHARNPTLSMVDTIDELFNVCQKDWLSRYYSSDVLMSADARARFVDPDRQPLDF